MLTATAEYVEEARPVRVLTPRARPSAARVRSRKRGAVGPPMRHSLGDRPAAAPIAARTHPDGHPVTRIATSASKSIAAKRRATIAAGWPNR